MSVNDKIKELNKKMAELAEERKLLFQENFKDIFKSTFEENPKLKSIRWQQYTPYFNDGDACYFSVYGFYAEVEGIKSWVYDESRYGGEADSGSEYDTVDEALENGYCFEDAMVSTWSDDCPEEIRDALNALASLPDEMFLDAFGDHVQVKATIDGFEVCEYDHD